MSARLLAVVAYPLFLAGQLSFAGGEVGNGLDYYRVANGHAWFLKGPVKYCVKVGADFGLEIDIFEKELTQALETWKKYMRFKRISAWVTFDEKKPPTDFRRQSCDGTEEVTFFLGDGKRGERTAEEGRLTRAEKEKYDRPLGFAKMLSYDLSKHKGKGIVWIAPRYSVAPDDTFPDWKEENLLRAVLLHQIGHILGASHQYGTIMALNLEEKLKDRHDFPKYGKQLIERMAKKDKRILELPAIREALSDPKPRPYPAQIDMESELVYCESCPYVFEAGFNLFPNESFNLLTGRLPAVNSEGDRIYGSMIYNVDKKGIDRMSAFTLFMRDSKEAFTYTVKPKAIISEVLISYQFVQYHAKDKTVAHESRGFAYLADLANDKGLKMPVIVTRNIPAKAHIAGEEEPAGPLGEGGIFNIIYHDKSGANTRVFQSSWPEFPR